MTANDTAISDFEANFTMVRSDGLDRQTYSLGNLTAVDAQNVRIENGAMTMPSTVDVAKNGMTIATRVNVTIAVEKLNVIKISMDANPTGILGKPIYGIVDALVRTSNGEKLVIGRGLTD
jgi:predicted secreted protein